jgi:ankyrin repeat protein
MLTSRASYYVLTQGDETPLYLASKFGNSEIVKLLTNARAKTHITVDFMVATAVHAAAANGHPDALQHLIDAGASVQEATDDCVRCFKHLFRQYFITPCAYIPVRMRAHPFTSPHRMATLMVMTMKTIIASNTTAIV